MEETILFKRNQFSSRLPTERLYTRSHFWLRELEPGRWQVGPTKFATRMLGEIVELDFEVKPQQEVEVAKVIGWIEGFKALSDIYCVATGTFLGPNEEAFKNNELICKDPYDKGWIYSVEGKPDSDAVDVHGYMEHLDATINKMLEKPWKSPTEQ